MRIKISSIEEANIQIKHIKKRRLFLKYLNDRDGSWNELVNEGKAKGKTFWNGLMYSFEGFNQNNSTSPILYFS